MEFDFSVKALFSEPISLITANSPFSNKHGRRGMGQHMEEVINTMGAKSALAQKLSSPITTSSRMRINGQRIYILTDSTANNGRGHVLGFIKVGQKQLFVLDREGTHNEMHPLCVLDFYIHESQQRKGHGIRLFKYMLEAENVDPSHLAIDRPSSKFTSFLRKHFNLWATIPQVNNFVVFDGFFKNRIDRKKNLRRSTRKEFEDNFRPMSRAFSEDVIKRNTRRNYNNHDTYNGIRPMSSTISNGSGDFLNHSRYQNSRHGARENMFSRFAADENSYIPSAPENRRRSLRSKQEDEIITNPYRRTTNVTTKNIEIASEEMGKRQEVEEYAKPLQELQHWNEDARIGGHVSVGTSATHVHDKTEVKRRKEYSPPEFYEAKEDYNAAHKNATGTVIAEKTNDDAEGKVVPRSHLFEAKEGYNSIRNTRYSRPSDMIAELKRKDQEATVRPPSNWHESMLGTSWNIFGIPSRSKQRWPK